MLPMPSMFVLPAGLTIGFLVIVGVQLGTRTVKKLCRIFKAHSTRNLVAIASFLFILSLVQKVFSSRIDALAAQLLPVDVFESAPSAMFLFLALAMYLTMLLAVIITWFTCQRDSEPTAAGSKSLSRSRRLFLCCSWDQLGKTLFASPSSQ